VVNKARNNDDVADNGPEDGINLFHISVHSCFPKVIGTPLFFSLNGYSGLFRSFQQFRLMQDDPATPLGRCVCSRRCLTLFF